MSSKDRSSSPDTPERWHWAITPTQVEALKQGNNIVMCQVFTDNLTKLKSIIYRYCYRTKNLQWQGDCLNQVYIDLPRYDYTNTKTLFWSLRWSFRRACNSQASVCVSFDAPIRKGKNRHQDGSIDGTLGDFIAVDGFAELEEEESRKRALAIIAEQTQLTERQRDVLTAIALGCRAVKGLFAYERRQAFTF